MSTIQPQSWCHVGDDNLTRVMLRSVNNYDLGLYVKSCLKSFEIFGLLGLWELKYRNLITVVIVFILTFL
jgi:hypothetical protein